MATNELFRTVLHLKKSIVKPVEERQSETGHEKGISMNTSVITKEQYTKAVGREPVHDDLVRCNCRLAGEENHLLCGWNEELNLPYALTGRITWVTPETPNVSKRKGYDNGPVSKKR